MLLILLCPKMDFSGLKDGVDWKHLIQKRVGKSFGHLQGKSCQPEISQGLVVPGIVKAER